MASSVAPLDALLYSDGQNTMVGAEMLAKLCLQCGSSGWTVARCPHGRALTPGMLLGALGFSLLAPITALGSHSERTFGGSL